MNNSKNTWQDKSFKREKDLSEKYDAIWNMLAELLFTHTLKKVDVSEQKINWQEVSFETLIESISEEIKSLIAHWENKIFTWQEQNIFTFLYKNPWTTYSKDNLLDIIWDTGQVFDKVIDVIISRIRKKLPEWIKIETVRGIGYYLSHWDFSLENIKNKITLDTDIYFIPQLNAIYTKWELIFFTSKEGSLFYELIKKPNKIRSMYYLKNMIWSEEVKDNTISAFINSITRSIY